MVKHNIKNQWWQQFKSEESAFDNSTYFITNFNKN
jgi:hypothetical protein